MSCCDVPRPLCHYWSSSKKFCWISNKNSNKQMGTQHGFLSCSAICIPFMTQNPASLRHFPVTSFFPLNWFASKMAFLVFLLFCPLRTIHIPLLTQVLCYCVFLTCMFVIRLVCYMVYLDILCGRLPDSHVDCVINEY